jgi:hypothetical protein
MVTTGRLDPNDSAFLPAFEAFQQTTAAQFFPPTDFPSDILATRDFADTVHTSLGDSTDFYLRPVQWIVVVHGGPMVIMSQWEVNELFNDLRESRHVTLHQYLPRRNLAFPSLDDLSIFTLPRSTAGWKAPHHLIAQLDLFAGQLWLNTHRHYIDMCRFLGLSYEVVGQGKVQVDGFEGKTEENPDCGFSKSPVAFLKVIMGLRADSGVARTDIGRMLGGEILTRTDFDRVDAVAEERGG